MQKVVLSTHPAVDLCDPQALETLLGYLPQAIRGEIRRRIFRAFELSNRERHIEVIEVVSKVLSICGDIAPRLPQIVGGKAIREAYNAADAAPIPTFLSVQLLIRFLVNAPFYKTAIARANACRQLQEIIEDQKDWNCVEDDGNGCGAYYRFHAASKRYVFKLIRDLPVSAIYVCCVIFEVDSFPDWVSFCCRLENQGDVSRFHKGLFCVLEGAWPFTDRDLFLEGYGVNDLEKNRRVWVVARSLEEAREDLPRGVWPPPRVEGRLRCEVFSGFRVDITSPTTTRLFFIVSIDPKIPVIPQTMISWITKKIMVKIMVEITKAATLAQDHKSKYFSRRRVRPDTYSMLREIFNETIEKIDPLGYKHHAIPEDY